MGRCIFTDFAFFVFFVVVVVVVVVVGLRTFVIMSRHINSLPKKYTESTARSYLLYKTFVFSRPESKHRDVYNNLLQSTELSRLFTWCDILIRFRYTSWALCMKHQ